MIAIGCLLLIILPIAGFAVGLIMAGTKVAIGAALVGFAIAGIICGITAYALVRAGRRD